MYVLFLHVHGSSAHDSPSSKSGLDRHRCWQVACLQKSKEELVRMKNIRRYQFAEGYS